MEIIPVNIKLTKKVVGGLLLQKRAKTNLVKLPDGTIIKRKNRQLTQFKSRHIGLLIDGYEPKFIPAEGAKNG